MFIKRMKMKIKVNVASFVTGFALGFYLMFLNSQTPSKPTHPGVERGEQNEFHQEPSSNANLDVLTSDNYFADLMEAIQSERKYTLLNACAKRDPQFKGPTDEPNRRTLYSKSYKYAVCEIHKCGFSSWLRAVLVMEGHYSVDDYFKKLISGPKAIELGKKEASFGFNTDESTMKALWNSETFSIITVREPLSRLVSAYHDKMKLHGSETSDFYEPLSRKINRDFRHMRHNPEQRSITGDGLATFEDFLNFLLAQKKTNDGHWMHYDSKCRPCHFRYDYIMKFDTLNADVQYLKQRLNISDLHSKAFFPQHHYKSNYEKVERQFKDIPKDLTLKVFEHYRIDYELFGFNKPSWL